MKLYKMSMIVTTLLLSSMGSNVIAANVTGSFQATASVNKVCILKVDNLDLGLLNINEEKRGYTVANLKCSKNTPWVMSVGPGSGTLQQRTMLNTDGASDKLKYNLYLGYGSDLVFGDGTDGTHTVNNLDMGTQDSTDSVIPISAKVPALQFVKVGSYADTIRVNIEY